MQRLLYETMGLEIRLRNKPTDKMLEDGKLEGSPSTDALAIQYALIYDCKARPELVPVLKAMQEMQEISTRRKLYYKPYPLLLHWSDNRLHPGIRQSAQATRRNTASGPNVTQLPKHPKATGNPAKFRECFIPHKRGALIFPPDFSGQELRGIAEYSQDANMLACFVGDDLKDMHALTAVGIARSIGRKPEVAERWLSFLPEGSSTEDLKSLADCTYEQFAEIRKDKDHKLHSLFEKGLRPLGKKTNFTTEYGAAAPKLARTLICTQEEAQEYIDAKLAAFPQVEVWKQETLEFLHRYGYGVTMMGARRHLARILKTGTGYEKGKAERQDINFYIQGSCAEQTKMAMGRVWRSGVLFKHDSEFYMPVHDELVFSVVVEDAVPFVKEVNTLMTMPYATQKVPIIAAISVGPDYGRQIECGDEFDEARVEEAVAKAVELSRA
jgi:DNA polymerase I-like protein with 3'-5' exonuclease and polymerase domains